MGALQTAGLQPAPLAWPARGDHDDGLGASAMASSRKSAAFSGDGGPDMGEVGHDFPRDLLTSLEPDESQGAWAGDGDLPASQPLTRVPVLFQARSPTPPGSEIRGKNQHLAGTSILAREAPACPYPNKSICVYSEHLQPL